MSSIPGYTLESFLAWYYGLVVEDLGESNLSLGLAEMLLGVKARPVLSKERFTMLVCLYEPHREVMEMCLSDFDEETQSWRSYAEVVDMDVPEETHEKAVELLKVLLYTEPKQNKDTNPMAQLFKKGEYRRLTPEEIGDLMALRPKPSGGLTTKDLEDMVEYVMFDVLLSPEGNPSTTVCRIYLTETFSVQGVSNVLDHKNYNVELGNYYSYLDAFSKLWDYVAVIKHFQR